MKTIPTNEEIAASRKKADELWEQFVHAFAKHASDAELQKLFEKFQDELLRYYRMIDERTTGLKSGD